ncbi:MULTISPECIES: carbonic anhydrase [Mycobacteriaceae]|uniref:Uncharacterized protein n=1 Tax=Mycolicibacterium parafortuitum TaxID=39692 RepID=A0ACC6MA77_MYCPF|nr:MULTISPECIES: carbonic anhydrase [Mycobacteriaceae]MDZ5083838.1 hypothetical protein [Mycolicibacterium parafortuitum]GFM16685.1 carbonic anhydrase [Mycobacterium sp. PO1]GFM21632.1 carbonic anhydrase [Mycobacterium sp. PO2]
MSNPQEIWNRLRAGADGLHAPNDTDMGRPVAAVLRCADATMSGPGIFGRPAGSLVDLSSWGLAVDTSVLAGVDFAVETAEVPLIVVLGHDDCAAIRAAVKAWNHAELPDGAMRAAVEGVLMSLVGRGASVESHAHVAAAHAVETGLSLLKRSPALTHRVDDGTCGIVCATYDGAVLRVHATMGDVRDASAALVECV